MSYFILFPNSAGFSTNLLPIPIGRDNYLCVNDYPKNLGLSSYVYSNNDTLEDLYNFSNIETNFLISINNVSVFALWEKSNTTNVCTGEISIRPNASTYRSSVITLDNLFSLSSIDYQFNPETSDIWSITDINSLQAGARMISAGLATDAILTQLYVKVEFEIISEKFSNFDFPNDIIEENLSFSILAKPDILINLYDSSSVKIIYKDPSGNEGSLDGNIVNDNYILATVLNTLTNNNSGKWYFKTLITFSSGQTIEGKPFFINIVERWL